MNKPNMFRVNYKETFVVKGWRSRDDRGCCTMSGDREVWVNDDTRLIQADIHDLSELCEYAHSPREIVSVYPIYIEVDDRPLKQAKIDAGIKDGAYLKMIKRKKEAVEYAVKDLASREAELEKSEKVTP